MNILLNFFYLFKIYTDWFTKASRISSSISKWPFSEATYNADQPPFSFILLFIPFFAVAQMFIHGFEEILQNEGRNGEWNAHVLGHLVICEICLIFLKMFTEIEWKQLKPVI